MVTTFLRSKSQRHDLDLTDTTMTEVRLHFQSAVKVMIRYVNRWWKDGKDSDLY